ncbi:MAG: hypothetical protein EA383_14610 [Spirochaetaceae bacterium]|nr:MAG: hypothetical protein EA383_14610 [Spirochaetaceae bacterium]
MDFWTRMKQTVDKGVETSHDLFEKAKERAQDLSRTGVLKYELMQLEDQAGKQLARLGTAAYEVLQNGKAFTTDNEGVSEIMEEISSLKSRIASKEQELSEAGGKPEDA